MRSHEDRDAVTVQIAVALTVFAAVALVGSLALDLGIAVTGRDASVPGLRAVLFVVPLGAAVVYLRRGRRS